MVFQDARLFPHLTVEGNLNFAADRAAGQLLPRTEVISALGIEGLLPRTPEGLSGGGASARSTCASTHECSSATAPR